MFAPTSNKCRKGKLSYGISKYDFLTFLASCNAEDKAKARINEKSYSLTCSENQFVFYKLCI